MNRSRKGLELRGPKKRLAADPFNLNSHESYFSSSRQMRFSLKAMLAFLKEEDATDRGALGFVPNKIDVVSSKKKEAYSMEFNFSKRTVTIFAPLQKGAKHFKTSWQLEVLKAFLPTFGESYIRAAIQLLRSLDDASRKKLVADYVRPNVSSNR